MSTKREKLTNNMKALLKDFSLIEIREVLSILENEDIPQISKSIEQEKTFGSLNKKKIKDRTPNKPISEQRSKAVIELENIDSEKYQILSDFDQLIRKGEILPNVIDIRKLGNELSKDFPKSKSRRQLISQLMKILSERSLDDVKKIFNEVLSSGSTDESDYQKLAKYIISGDSN